ncbi:MAG: DUF4230 domain-containing protein [Myxococcales bacterium]
MVKRLVLLAVFALFLGVGAVAAFKYLPERAKPLPDPPAVVTQIREVARLETLDVAIYKKVRFAPEPAPGSDSLWGDVLSWASYTLRGAEGRAIVFATAHLGLDLEQFGPESVRVVGRTALVVLPPIRVQIELKPGETEVIGSNLDSQETAKLFDKAKGAFEAEVRADPVLNRRARDSAQRAIRALLVTLGFEQVQFVDVLPAASAT